VMAGDGKVLGLDFVLKVPQLREFVVAQKFNQAAFTNTAAVTVYGAFSTNVAQMPDIASFRTLFDKYKLLKVEIYFVPYLADMNTTSVASTIPRLHTVVDQDDETAPASISELEQYSTYAMCRGTQPLYRTYKPRAIMAIYQSAIATSYAVAPDVWLDLANETIPHYGCKYAFAASSVANIFGYTVEVVLTAAFSNVR
jgi:hypothetical protein